MFMADLFVIAKTWKQLRCPSVGEWINTCRYIQTMEYYSASKRNEFYAVKRYGRNLNAYITK